MNLKLLYLILIVTSSIYNQQANYCTSSKCGYCLSTAVKEANTCSVCVGSSRVLSKNKDHPSSFSCEGTEAPIKNCMSDDGTPSCKACKVGFALSKDALTGNMVCVENVLENCKSQDEKGK